MTSEKQPRGDEPPPYSSGMDSRSETNNYGQRPGTERMVDSVDADSRSRDHQMSEHQESNRPSAGRYNSFESDDSDSMSETYQSNNYTQDAGMGRREFASNSNFDPRPRSQDYQNGYLNGNEPGIGRRYRTSNRPFTSDPRDQQYPTNNYMQQDQLPMGRRNYQSNGYADRSEPPMGRRYDPANQTCNSNLRDQKYQTGYTQLDQADTGRGFRRFEGMQDTGRAYDDMNDGDERRNDNRRHGGRLQRRRDRKAERGGGLLHMAFDAVTGLVKKV